MRGLVNSSCFELICTVSAAFFWLLQLWLAFMLNKDENTQRRQSKPAGFLLLLPAIGITAAGVMLLFKPDGEQLNEANYYVVVLSAENQGPMI